MNTVRSVLGLIVIVLLVSSATPSLSAEPPDSASGAIQRKVMIATDPILDMFQWYTGEIQIRIAQTLSTGVAGSYLSLDDENDTYASGNVFLRYYPQGETFVGWFLGTRVGIYNVSAEAEDIDGVDETVEEEEATMYGFGIEIGYCWLLGAAKRVSISSGIGAVRLFGGDFEEEDDVLKTIPTIRLVYVGIAF